MEPDDEANLVPCGSCGGTGRVYKPTGCEVPGCVAALLAAGFLAGWVAHVALIACGR